MILFEIALTIVAWNRGWRWRALLPLGTMLTVGFIMGIAVGASGGRIEDVLPVAIFGELVGILALIIMAIRRPAAVSAAPAPALSLGGATSHAHPALGDART